jgi:hypothetical protein
MALCKQSPKDLWQESGPVRTAIAFKSQFSTVRFELSPTDTRVEEVRALAPHLIFRRAKSIEEVGHRQNDNS